LPAAEHLGREITAERAGFRETVVVLSIARIEQQRRVGSDRP
jgi:hypothetical protein